MTSKGEEPRIVADGISGLAELRSARLAGRYDDAPQARLARLRALRAIGQLEWDLLRLSDNTVRTTTLSHEQYDV